MSSLFEGCKNHKQRLDFEMNKRSHEVENICTNGKTCGVLENV